MTTTTNEAITESKTVSDVPTAVATTAAADQSAARAAQAKRDATFFNLGYGLLIFGAIMALVVLGLVAFHNA